MSCDPRAIAGDTVKAAFTKERAQFKALLLTNPNYFGTDLTSTLPPVLPMAGNTYYEELGCVGYHPQQEMLEGVVYVHQPSGYGGGLCGSGSSEFVRFFLSFDHGLTWVDQGLSGCQVWDVPEGTEGTRRLEYAVQLKVDPARRPCSAGSQLIRMRGILSWNAPPPPNQPNWTPAWGNRRDAVIVVEPRRLLVLDEVFQAAKVKLPPPLQQALDLQAPVAAPPRALTIPELGTLYAKSPVPVGRFAYKELHRLAHGPQPISTEVLAQALPGLQIDPKLVDVLIPPDLDPDGDTSYEELSCIGLDPNLPDTLVGIVHVKRSLGFNGGPCTSGSTEHVSFWIDADRNGSFETFLGTASVGVHDMASMPAEGVHLAVRLPVDLSAHRRACKRGPALLPVRAILSWNVPVPGHAPNTTPAWGNREETLVMLTPEGLVHAPAGQIAILGGIPVSMIGAASGRTTADAVFALNNQPVGGDAPFGGIVTVQGAPMPAGWRYKVEVTPEAGGAPQPLLDTLTLTRADGSTYEHAPHPVTQTYAYVGVADNVNSLLARWHSAGDARWIVTLTTYDLAGNPTGSDSHRIQLDNTAPVAAISITSGTGDCGKFPAGSTISGVFTATDDNLSHWSIGIKPPGLNDPGEAITVPSYGTLPAVGGGWSLDTEGMVACGYIAEIVVVDRTIVHSQSQGWRTPASVGFCLEAAAEAEADAEA